MEDVPMEMEMEFLRKLPTPQELKEQFPGKHRSCGSESPER